MGNASQSMNKKSSIKNDLDPSLEGKLEIIKKYGLTQKDLVHFFENIFTSRVVDDTEISMKKQSKAFFQISGAGHEGIQTALAKVLKPGHDYFCLLS